MSVTGRLICRAGRSPPGLPRASAMAGAHKDDLGELLEVFRDLGVPEDLVAATGVAAGRTREPITVMVPLIWLAAAASSAERQRLPDPASGEGGRRAALCPR